MDLRNIVDQARSGDACAFDRLVDGCRDTALGYARTLTQDRDAAEDAVQEALVVAHRSLDRLADSRAFVAWLRGIVRHRCLRGASRKAIRLDEDLAQPATGELDPTEAYQLIAAVARLPEEMRRPVCLHYEDGLSQAEIAARLGVSKGTVNMRLHAARARLRRRLIMLNEPIGATPSAGCVEAVEGPLVTLRFSPDRVPFIFSRLVSDKDALCVVRALPDGTVQAMPRLAGGIWTAGREVRDTGQPFLDPLPDSIASEIGSPMSSSTGAFLRTGIKTVDLFAPLTDSGRTGIFAEWGVGTLVLLPELVRRLEASTHRHTFVAFMPAVRNETEWRNINAEAAVGTRRIEVLYVPVEDPLVPSFIDRQTGLSARLVLSRALAEQGIWPCIDPLRSGSAISELADEVRDLLRRYYALQNLVGAEASRRLSEGDWTAVRRARMALRFLSQPFFVAEPFTGRPGVDADPETARLSFRGILDGAFDDRSKEDFMMVGDRPRG